MDPQNIPPQPQPEESIPSRPIPSFTLPLIFGILTVLIIVGVGGYYLGKRQVNQPPTTYITPTSAVILSPNPIPTIIQDETVYTEGTRSANWKSYSGQGISFKYPNNLVEQPYKTYGGGNIPEEHFIDNQSKEVLWFRIQDNINPPNGQQPYTDLDDLCRKQDLKNQQCLMKKIMIDNLPALDTGNGVLFLSTGGSKFYDLQLDGPNLANNQTIIKQILSTFKFLDQAPTGTAYKCPETDYVDCMPVVGDGIKFECTQQYLNWAKQNCPNFKGAAY